jgi:hypothetical protein
MTVGMAGNEALDAYPHRVSIATLTGTLTMTKASESMQVLDPGGADRTVTLPPVAAAKGRCFYFYNSADAQELLNLSDGSTIATVGPGQCAVAFSYGTDWKAFVAKPFPEAVFETKTEAFTPAYSDSGKTFFLGAADIVVTLPATLAGLKYRFVVTVPSAATGAVLSPVSVDKILGLALDTDLTNTGATDAIGDLITLLGDGADGWIILEREGTWA